MNTSMQMPERVQIEETEIANQGRYVLQPLEEGYGVTIGNALRRVLMQCIADFHTNNGMSGNG